MPRLFGCKLEDKFFFKLNLGLVLRHAVLRRVDHFQISRGEKCFIRMHGR